MSESSFHARTQQANRFGLVVTPSPEPAEVEDEPVAEPPVQSVPPAVDPPTTQPPKPPKRRRAALGPRPTTVSVPADLVPLWRERARLENVSQADVLFDAIEAHLEQLPALISAEQTVPAGGLFERSKRRGKVLLAGVSLRLSASTDQALGDVEQECGAASRSQLVTVALRAYLKG